MALGAFTMSIGVHCRCGAWEPLDVVAGVRCWSKDPETTPPTVSATLRWPIDDVVLPVGWEIRHTPGMVSMVPTCPVCLKNERK